MKPRILFSIPVILALLIALLPMGSTTAQGNQPNCPPFNPTLTNDPSFIKSLSKECQTKYKQLSVSPQISSLSQKMLLASIGPDDFGYTFDDTVPFNWISASYNTGLTGDDSGPFSGFSIGFDFPFYGQTYSQLYFSTNGLITFDQRAQGSWGGVEIPNPATPNNYIAPFWDDLLVGSPYNTGGIYYSSGGDTPNRYFILEWRDVTTYAGSEPFSFEAILYENGDILFQIQSLPASYYSTVGIENNIGDDGLAYQTGGYQPGDGGFSAPKAIQFYFPTTPTARVSVSPLASGKLASTDSNTYFPINITNIGTAGTDTYNLSATSIWAASFYHYDAINDTITPLTDTNADTIIDTGPISQGSSTAVAVGFSPPSGLDIGDANSANISITSILDPSKTKIATMNMVIPAPFAQVFEDYTNAANVFMINGPNGSISNYVTDDFYFANGLATVGLPGGGYIYAWRKPDGNYPNSFSDIEFTLLAQNGIDINLPVTKLTSNIGTGQTYDYEPAVAVAPNGTIGVIWRRWLVDNSTNQTNYNIYFATLSDTGSLLYGPVNLTNNNLWDNFNNINAPHFFSPAIAANADNRFVLSWSEYRTDGISSNLNNIWYATRDSTGASILAPTALTNDGSSYSPVLNQLTGNNSILTWVTDRVPYYAVINSNGSLSKAATALAGFSYSSTDAVTLPNGAIAVAWTTTSPDIAYVILDASYNVAIGPTYANNPYAFYNTNLSITYDSSDHIIMTWTNDDSSPPTSLFYALADDTGTFITNPISFRYSPLGIITAFTGQGNAPHITISTLQVSIDIMPGKSRNRIEIKPAEPENDDKISVAILSTEQFNAPQQVDRSSLTFGSTGDENSLSLKVRKHIPECQTTDVNKDGLLDLVCKFTINKTGFQLDDTTGILKGLTVDGLPIEGQDSVVIKIDD